MYQHPRNVSMKIDKDISSRVGNIPKFVGFHEGSMPTTRLIAIQKIQNHLEPVYQHLRNVSKKIQRDIWSRTWDIPIFVYFLWESKPTNRLTDIQEIQNYLDLVYKHPRKAPKEFQWDISSRTGDICLSNFSKEVSKYTHWQTYMICKIISS